MVKSHYEKIILLISVLIALTFSLLLPFLSSMFSEGDSEPLSVESFGESFVFGMNDAGLQTLELTKNNSLMPGDTITFVSIEDENKAKSFLIPKIIFKSRSRLTVGFDKKEITGKLVSGMDVVLDGDWKRNRASLEIANEEDRGRSTVPFAKINYVSGERLLAFDEPIEEFDSEEWRISFHQPLIGVIAEHNQTQTDRVRWTKPIDESGDSIYDLFTPPIIYLIDGNLTTSLPEKKEVRKTEEFGLSLRSFQKKPYRFKMRGFSNTAPFFEDMDPTIKDKRLNPKTRIEVNAPYRINTNGKPGSTSLIKTTEDDENKVLIVTYFRLEYMKDEKTGGVKPVGRALVKDYKIGGKPFEINSRMQEVFAGDNKIELSFNLDGPSEQIVLSDKDTGKVLEFGSRKYLIKEINAEEKSLLIEKRGPLPNITRTEKLSLR